MPFPLHLIQKLNLLNMSNIKSFVRAFLSIRMSSVISHIMYLHSFITCCWCLGYGDKHFTNNHSYNRNKVRQALITVHRKRLGIHSIHPETPNIQSWCHLLGSDNWHKIAYGNTDGLSYAPMSAHEASGSCCIRPWWGYTVSAHLLWFSVVCWFICYIKLYFISVYGI